MISTLVVEGERSLTLGSRILKPHGKYRSPSHNLLPQSLRGPPAYLVEGNINITM